MELVTSRQNIGIHLDTRLGLEFNKGEDAAEVEVGGWRGSRLRMVFGPVPWARKLNFLRPGPQRVVAGRTLVFSWYRTREVGLVDMQGENKIPRTAFS